MDSLTGGFDLRLRSGLLIFAATSVLAGCNSTSSTGLAPAGASGFVPVPAGIGSGVPGGASALEYRLGPLDTIKVTVFQSPELSGDFQIGSDGALVFPLIGSVRAAGRTSQQLQADITSRLQASYLQSPQVTVTITGFNSQKVAVDGSVQTPGVFPVSASGTLLNYIALAGGMPRGADSANVIVFRDSGGQRVAAKFDVDAIRKGKAQDPEIFGGDTIIVPASGVRSAWEDLRSALPAARVAATVGGF